MRRIPDCHPNRLHYAKGRCERCYWNDYNTNHKQERSDYARKSYELSGRTKRRLRYYNISEEKYQVLLLQQNYRCAICQEEKELVIDHDHSCCPKDSRSCGKCIRGLLCQKCNNMLTIIDNKNLFDNAIAYLEKYRGYL
jgi:hypothetical protein